MSLVQTLPRKRVWLRHPTFTTKGIIGEKCQEQYLCPQRLGPGVFTSQGCSLREVLLNREVYISWSDEGMIRTLKDIHCIRPNPSNCWHKGQILEFCNSKSSGRRRPNGNLASAPVDPCNKSFLLYCGKSRYRSRREHQR